MRISIISLPVLIALALPVRLQSQTEMPMIRSVDPPSGKGGDVLAVQGENLGRERVTTLYLTDGQRDIKVPILEQTSTSIKFRIPPEAKPGRFALMVLTKDEIPRLIEQPVKVTVEPATTGSMIAVPDQKTTRLRRKPVERLRSYV